MVNSHNSKRDVILLRGKHKVEKDPPPLLSVWIAPRDARRDDIKRSWQFATCSCQANICAAALALTDPTGLRFKAVYSCRTSFVHGDSCHNGICWKGRFNLPKPVHRSKQATSRVIAILQPLGYRLQLHTLSTSERYEDGGQSRLVDVAIDEFP